MQWPWQKKRTSRIYLDHAAATPLLPAAKIAMEPYLTTEFGNPSAIHTEGRKAREAVEAARAKLARLLKVRDTGVVFTGSGTESNNLALVGWVRQQLRSGHTFSDLTIITTAIEHPSTHETVKSLAADGVTVAYVPVDADGLIVEAELLARLTDKTTLVTFAYANSEIGVVQDVHRLVRVIKKQQPQTLVHLDAAQAPYWLPCQFDKLGVDLLTLDAGKCGGPKGVGVLAFRHGVELKAVTLGGKQEGRLRAGTENVAGIVGAVTAIEAAQTEWERRSAAVAKLRDAAIAELLQIEGAVLNGSAANRIANNINISLPGFDTEYAAILLDAHGVAVSTKSACSGAGAGGSTVVTALGGDPARVTSTLRLTLGPDTTFAELQHAVSILREHVTRMRTALRKSAE